MRARSALAAAMALWLSACGGQTTEPSSGDAGGGGQGGGGTWVVPPAGLGEYACPAGELVLDDGGCQPAGTLPSGCPTGFEQVADACEPILPTADCAPGEVAYPGETQCHPLAACAAGKWGSTPTDATTVYVDGGFVGSSDGSEQAPFVTIPEALLAAQPGAIVAVAAGTYSGVVIQDKPVSLWGVCPQQTVLMATSLSAPGADVKSNGSGSELHMLSIQGLGGGIRISDAADVLLDRIHIHDTDGIGLDARWTSSPPTSLTIRDLLIESALYYAFVGVGVDMDAARIVVRDTRPSPGGSVGRGMDLEGSLTDAPLVKLDRVLLQRNSDLGMFVRDVDLVADALVVDDTASQPFNGNAGMGLHVKSHYLATRLVARGLAVRRAAGCGVCLLGSAGDLEALTVRDVTSSPAFAQDGYGVAYFQQDDPVDPTAEVRVLGAVVERTQGSGVVLDGNAGRFESVVVRDVEPFDANLSGGLGRGITAQANKDLGLPSALTLRGARVERVHEFGVLAHTEAWLETVVVSDVKPDRLGRFGRGIAVEASVDVAANAVVRGSVVEEVHDAGIIVLGGSAELEATAVRHVAARASDATGGMGVVLQSGAGFGASGVIRNGLVDDATAVGVAAIGADLTVEGTLIRGTKVQADGNLGDGVAGIPWLPNDTRISLTGCHLLDNSRAGAAAFSSVLSLASTTMDCNAIALNGEGFSGPFELEDLGGNVCGCMGESEPCQVLSAAMPPPTPLDESAGSVDEPPP